eukprot:10859629-Alexandrium_andersonii.AAC.1
MSASLVGSEMCIRDSTFARQPRLRLVRPLPADRPRQAVQCRPGRRRAVSYTHLTLPTICSV